MFESLVADNDSVVVVGRSTCSDARLAGAALWVAKARDDKLVEWQVYEDKATNRRALGVVSHNPDDRLLK